MVDVPLPAVIGDVAVTVDCSTDTVPAFTTTVAVWVIATVLIVADSVFDSATVELNVPVATPLAFVDRLGGVSGLPVPVGGRPTVALGIGLPNASFAVAVTVLWVAPVEAVMGDVAVTVDWVADRAPGVTTTAALCVTATPSTVAVTVLDSATVELNVPVATPLAFVVALGCVSVLPVPVAAMTTVAPAIRFPRPSRAVTLIVDWLVPLEAVMGDAADTLDCPPETALPTTWTVAVSVIASVLIVADTVLDS